MDFSKMTDEELERIASQPRANAAGTQLTSRPAEAKANQITQFSSLSDSELEKMAGIEKPQMGFVPALGQGLVKGADILGLGPYLAGTGQAIGEGVGIATSGGGLLNAVKNVPEAFGRGRRAEVENRRRSSERLGLLDIPVQIAGGLVTAPVTATATLGKTALGTLGKSAAFGAGQGFVQGLGESGDVGEAAKSAAVGGLLGGAGGGLAAGAQKIGQTLEKPLKGNVGNIRQAAKELGTKPTAGMLVDDPMIQRAESALVQKPTVPAAKYREAVEEIQDRVQAGAQNLLSGRSAQSATVAGQEARESLLGRVLEQGKQAAEPFEKIRESTKFMDVDPKGFERVVSGVKNIKAPFPGGKVLVQNYADEIAGGIKTVDDVKQWRTAVGNDMRQAFETGDKNKGAVLSQIYKRLEALEARQILKNSIETAKQGFPRKGEAMGKEISKGIIGELKGARRNYSQYRRDVEALARSLGVNEKLPPDQLVKKLENMESAQLTQKLFQSGKPEATKRIKETAPQAFEIARKAHLKELFDDVVKDDEIQVGKLLQKLNKYEPESLEMLLGGKNKVRTFQNIKTVYEAQPKMAGPSGTPAGNLFMNFVSMITSPAESLKDAAAAAVLRRATTGTQSGRNVAKGLLTGTQSLGAVTDNE